MTSSNELYSLFPSRSLPPLTNLLHPIVSVFRYWVSSLLTRSSHCGNHFSRTHKHYDNGTCSHLESAGNISYFCRLSISLTLRFSPVLLRKNLCFMYFNKSSDLTDSFYIWVIFENNIRENG